MLFSQLFFGPSSHKSDPKYHVTLIVHKAWQYSQKKLVADKM